MKLQTKELRIGNLIYWDIPEKLNRPHEVVGIFQDRVQTVPISLGDSMKDYLPILLTPEWLKRLSFKKVKNESDGAIWQNKKIVLKYSVGSFRLFISDTEDDWYYTTSIVVETVHRLQNIFHSLTGKELTLKP